MKYAIFGDIHGNLPALEAVLQDIQQQRVDQTVCLGDIAGTPLNSRTCLEIVHGSGCPCVKGETDENAPIASKLPILSATSQSNIEENIPDPLTENQRSFLWALPLIRTVDSFTIVHASLYRPETWPLILQASQAESSFQLQETHLCFFSHTRIPHVYIQDTRVHQFFYKKIELLPDKKYLVNSGSVGAPADGDWRAAYAIYNASDQTIELRRIPYKSNHDPGDCVPSHSPRNPSPSLSASLSNKGET